MVSFPLRELNVQIRNLTFETSHIDIIKIKKTGYSFIVELHLLIKEHNPVKEKSNFTIFLCKANVFRLQEQGFTTLQFFLYVSFLAKFNNQFFCLTNGSLAQDRKIKLKHVN